VLIARARPDAHYVAATASNEFEFVTNLATAWAFGLADEVIELGGDCCGAVGNWH
jgi:hypothetical protein